MVEFMDVVALKKLMKAQGVTQTQLAQLLGRDKSAVTNLFKGIRQLKADEAALIAQALSVPMAEIMGMGEEAPGVNEPRLIPFQHAPLAAKASKQVVKQGNGFFFKDSEDYGEKAYALEMRDDSMNLAGILRGDIIIATLDGPYKAGQLVVAQHYGPRGAQTIIRTYAPPLLTPHSTNDAFTPLMLERDDVRVVSPVMKLIRLL